MKNYLVKSDNRRPMKFNGELLGESSHLTDEEFASSLQEEIKDSKWDCPPYGSDLKLSLYRTESGKIVLHQKRFGYSDVPSIEGFNGVMITAEIFDTLDDYILSTAKKNGSVGRVTTELMNDVISNYPEVEDHWVETID